MKRTLLEFERSVLQGKRKKYKNRNWLSWFFSFSSSSAQPLDYNGMHRFITEEIHKQGYKDPVLVSWLSDAQKPQAIAEWKGIRQISSSSNQLPIHIHLRMIIQNQITITLVEVNDITTSNSCMRFSQCQNKYFVSTNVNYFTGNSQIFLP